MAQVPVSLRIDQDAKDPDAAFKSMCECAGVEEYQVTRFLGITFSIADHGNLCV